MTRHLRGQKGPGGGEGKPVREVDGPRQVGESRDVHQNTLHQQKDAVSSPHKLGQQYLSLRAMGKVDHGGSTTMNGVSSLMDQTQHSPLDPLSNLGESIQR